MNRSSFDKILHNGRLHRTLRRAVAFALTLAMILPMTAAFADGGGLIAPYQSSDHPRIEIEGNFVRDDFGALTGYFELGLRVQTPAGKTFSSMEVTLEYDTTFLTPVDWDTKGAEISVTGAGDFYTTLIPAQKHDNNSTAVAYSGIPTTLPAGKTVGETTVSLSDGVKNGNKALLTFTARTIALPLSYEKMTTIAAIRFKVNEQQMKNFTISKRIDATGTGTTEDAYDVLYNKTAVTNVDELEAAMNALTADTGVKVMGFATDEDIYLSEPDVKMALHYVAAYKEEYYYISGYDAGKNISVKETIGEKEYTLDKPSTLNQLILAVDPNISETEGATEGASGKYSYLSNLIVNTEADTYISFPIVSKRSFTAKESVLDNLTTIVYVDWDNTILGTQIVPKNTDIRTLVSDYVAKEFIYHEDNKDDPNGKNPTEDPDSANDLRYPKSLSLARVDNYRGKYIATEPGLESASDGTNDEVVKKNAAAFPLTNKLDYVFFKRPMENVAEAAKPDPAEFVTSGYPDGTKNPDYTTALDEWQKEVDDGVLNVNVWKQKTEQTTTTTGGAEEGSAGVVASPAFDAEHPFAYGWAECTQATYQDVWTTLASTGELNDYSVNGDGFARVTYDGTQTFKFADLEKGLSADTVFLKAVYEPGTDLYINGMYRMYTEPAYNKLSGASAELGGAYSVTVNFERATIEAADTFVRGVDRMREPAVRQQTTPDLRWETDEALGVSHNLTNASLTEAKSDRNKTTYTKVTVDNTEVVNVQMALSARQNKVDYFFTEGYNNNFVSGGERTSTNFDRKDTAFTVDNYNYYVSGESEARDPAGYYFAVKDFDTKDGSHGFVLYGTLNNLMQKATQLYDGDILQSDYNRFVSTDTMMDANLRSDLNGSDPTDDIRTILKELAGKVETTYKGDPDYWDDTLNCAKLTYHQVQWYILEGSLLTPEAADAKLLGFCHLHAACAATTANKPTTWAKLMEAASGDETAQKTISDLTAGEIEKYFHLRSDGNGTQYTSPATFQSDVVAAVAALTKVTGVTADKLTWDQVQYYLVEGTADYDGNGTVTVDDLTAADEYGKENYWWYDGASKPTDLASVLKAAETVNSTGRNALLNTLETAFDSMKGAADDETAKRKAWIDLTENFATNTTNGNIDASTSFTALRDKLKAAVAALGSSADWGNVQFYILCDAEPTPSDADEIAGYWWHYGALQIKDIKTLIKAAEDYNRGVSENNETLKNTWNNFVYTDLYNENKELHFRSSFNGQEYAESQFEGFKQKVLDYAATTNHLKDNWAQLQYYLIHGTLQLGKALERNASYYWWEKNGNPVKEDFTLSQEKPEERAEALAAAISAAAFKAAYNGNTAAWDDLTDAVLENGRLINSYDGTKTTFNTLDKIAFADAAAKEAFTDALEALYESKVGTTTVVPVPASLPVLTWQEIQDSLLSDTDKANAATDEYWWKTKDAKPAQANTPSQDFQTLQEKLSAIVAEEEGAAEAFKEWFTEDIAKNLGLYSSDQESPLSQDEINDKDFADVDYSFCDDGNGNFQITWCQLQLLFFEDWIGDPEESESIIVDDYGIEDPSVSWISVANLMDRTMFSLSLETPLDQLTNVEEALRNDSAYVEENKEALRAEVQKILDLLDEDQAQTGDGDQPQTGDGDQPQTGDGDQIQTGDGDQLQTGDGDQIQTGDGDQTQTGDGDQPQTGDGDQTQTGDGDQTQTGDGDQTQTEGGDKSQSEDIDQSQTKDDSQTTGADGDSQDPGGSAVPPSGEGEEDPPPEDSGGLTDPSPGKTEEDPPPIDSGGVDPTADTEPIDLTNQEANNTELFDFDVLTGGTEQ